MGCARLLRRGVRHASWVEVHARGVHDGVGAVYVLSQTGSVSEWILHPLGHVLAVGAVLEALGELDRLVRICQWLLLLLLLRLITTLVAGFILKLVSLRTDKVRWLGRRAE